MNRTYHIGLKIEGKTTSSNDLWNTEIYNQREMIKRHLQAMPKASDREVADLLGCEPKEVGVVRRELTKGKLRIQTDG